MIATLLVANRGEIARRIMRTCRRLGIRTVAVYSEIDADAPFVHEADLAIPLGGASPAESYLRGDAIVAAARRAGADAVHPGYGFLAENAEFATAVIAAGMTWVGPSPEAIAAMGSKLGARALMEAAAVPVLPAVTLDLDADGIAAASAAVGYPLLAKASAGGGGKGMRIVADPGELERAIEAARREAEAAFSDGTIFLERYLEGARHVEVQILGDASGRVVALHERECSIQRRHQKILEECPSPAVTPSIRARLCAAAVQAGEAIGYAGAGTVEFLLTPAGEFYFLEVNTRLQVEHPVTEAVTGLDLVELQLLVAEGGDLPAEATAPRLSGHAIEVRLYAEDAERGFLPQVGRLARFRIPGDVRVDSGVEDGSDVSMHYDPMLAKVIAHAPSRRQAARALASALRRAELHGVTTNRDLLVGILEHPAFLAGEIDTQFLERHDPARLGASRVDAEARGLHAAAAALAAQAGRRAHAAVMGTLPSGWRNNARHDQRARYRTGDETIEIAYRFDRGRLASLAVDGEAVTGARLHGCSAALVDLEAGGVRRRYRVRPAGTVVHVDSEAGAIELVALPRHPLPDAERSDGSLASPMPGTVVRVDAAAGDRVAAGQVLLVIEAMKMEHEVVAPGDGLLERLLVALGDQVDAGAALAEIRASAVEPQQEGGP